MGEILKNNQASIALSIILLLINLGIFAKISDVEIAKADVLQQVDVKIDNEIGRLTDQIYNTEKKVDILNAKVDAKLDKILFLVMDLQRKDS